MEPAQTILDHVFCPIHNERIRKIGITNRTDLAVLCIECVDSKELNQNQERFILENFMKQIAQGYEQIPKLQQLPDSTNQILNTENEILANFSDHIEKEKKEVHNMIDKLRQSVYQKLETKKRQLIADLEAQFKAFEDVLTYYKKKIYCYREGEQDDRFKGQETARTVEELHQEAKKITNAPTLKRTMEMHYENMKISEIFGVVQGDEAKKLVSDAIKAMDEDLLKAQTLKPTIAIDGNNENLDNVFNKWDEQIDNVIKGLKIDVKDPVKPIKFQLQSSLNFDSVILGNNPESKMMITIWVLEAIKPNQASPTLLYRGTRDGFAASTFHQKCDNKGPTVTIIKSNYGKVFGGFTDVAWDSTTNAFKKTTKAFVFSIDRKGKYFVKPGNESNAIYSYSSYGPSFGSGHDIHICDNSNATGNSYSNFPHGYVCNEYANPGSSASNFLAGSYKFTVTDIEIFSV